MRPGQSAPVRSGSPFSVPLSSTPGGACIAHLLATEQLRDWGLPSDPAANAVTHGRVPGRDFRLTLYVVGDTLRIEVTDTRGERAPQAQHPAADAESGRGLLLVDALADRWGTNIGPHPRKTVWAEVTLPSPSPPKLSPLSSGDAGGLSKEPTGRKNPHQAPPLPPAAQTHSRE
ncbi:ATP-binding protein [Streptomyces sp. NBC_00827]|uniref:ATP-binding protein n=1 Tax=Streptomyces sp. NBC_00827 TaxID=2903677 RepID=UPI0038641919|nr:ATP-binding protein [Streptomyces sp. NBC_00827]